eukprot:53968-Pyramimonas_sp.AAC.1
MAAQAATGARRRIAPRPKGDASRTASASCQTVDRSQAKMGSKSLMVTSSSRTDSPIRHCLSPQAEAKL